MSPANYHKRAGIRSHVSGKSDISFVAHVWHEIDYHVIDLNLIIVGWTGETCLDKYKSCKYRDSWIRLLTLLMQWPGYECIWHFVHWKSQPLFCFLTQLCSLRLMSNLKIPKVSLSWGPSWKYFFSLFLFTITFLFLFPFIFLFLSFKVSLDFLFRRSLLYLQEVLSTQRCLASTPLAYPHSQETSRFLEKMFPLGSERLWVILLKWMPVYVHN